MAIDLSKLPKPFQLKQHLSPIDIFNALPRLKDSPNDLWAAQQRVLLKWHSLRTASDIVINLNTGAGKSIVGLLIAQSLVNEKIGPIIYCCATNDLVEQTAMEAERKLGLKYTTRARGTYSNTLFEEGKAFVITNYHTVFQAYSTFRGQLSPAAIIFDDAHVAEKVIRDCMSIRIERHKFPAVHDKFKAWFRDYFVSINRTVEFQARLSQGGDSILFVPSEGFINKESEILAELMSLENQSDDIKYALGHLATHLKHCFVTLSNEQIEFTPAFLPSLSLNFTSSNRIRRVYLSATMSSDAEFIRTFGRQAERIAIETDAGNGERLIVFVDKIKDSNNIFNYYREQSKKRKILFAVPSSAAAKKWSEFGAPVGTAKFSTALSEFKQASRGAFILVARVDGIDLPGDTCRVMVLDGLPAGVSQFERFIDVHLGLYDFLNSKINTRITQLFGRINRGRSDYGAFLVHDPKLAVWLRRDRNVALLPDTLQKQILLGQLLHEQLGLSTKSISEFTDAVMAREERWTEYYQSFLESMDIDQGDVQKSKEVSDRLSRAATHEARAASALWDSRYEDARKEYADCIEIMQAADEGMVGFYMLMVGNVLGIEGDIDSARKHFHLAGMKLPRGIILPRLQMTINSFKSAQMNAFQQALCDTFVNDLIDANRRSKSLTTLLEKLVIPGAGASEYDEALKQLGATLGFRATRPDQEAGEGPDVLWEERKSRCAIAFETKVEKTPSSSYSKKEIGQCHNHLQWIKDNKKELRLLGLAIIGDCVKVDATASPSENMMFVSKDNVKRVATRVRDLLSKIALQTPLERRGSINSLNESTEFEIEKIWEVLIKDAVAKS
jgi:hypothetical protein